MTWCLEYQWKFTRNVNHIMSLTTNDWQRLENMKRVEYSYRTDDKVSIVKRRERRYQNKICKAKDELHHILHVRISRAVIQK